MDVTSDNFEKLLPLIRESINKADYIAYDLEFSGTQHFPFKKSTTFLNWSLKLILGLNIGFDDKQHEYDRVEDRYQKLKHNCTRMNAFQVGLVTFKWNPLTGKYSARPFNFYVFPNSQLFDS